jgi:hypothetical protein
MISNDFIGFIESMKHSPARNYVIPGLTSWLIGSPHPIHGCVRLFTMSREHEESIIPHSHRFDFRCLVLRGKVTNNIWVKDGFGDEYAISDVTYEGKLGCHKRINAETGKFSKISCIYREGQEYAMKAEQFHSIYFGKGSSVLFFEGANRLDKSQILEPVVMGERIPLFKTEDWMFRKDSEQSK